MKYARLIGAVALLSSAAALQPAGAAAWQVVGGQGARHFVTVAAGAAGEATYRQAAASVCRAGQACIVMFWTDAAQAATKVPLSTAQRAALAAQYTRNPATGHEELLLRCSGGTAPKGHCLR